MTTSSLEAVDPASPSKPLKRLDFGLLHHGDSRAMTFRVINASNSTAILHAACGLPQDFNDADRSAKDLSGFVQVSRFGQSVMLLAIGANHSHKMQNLVLCTLTPAESGAHRQHDGAPNF